MSDALKIEQSSKFPKDFVHALERSNLEKTHAPVALILCSKNDSNSLVFANEASRFLILQAAKTHRIAIKIIQDGNEFGQKIRQTSQQCGQKPSLLMIIAHGGSDHLRFCRERRWKILLKQELFQKSDIKESDFFYLAPHAKILLPCCETGQELAQKIADCSKRTVFAPMEKLEPAASVLRESSDGLQLLAYNRTTGRQIIRAFTPGKPSELLSPPDWQSAIDSQLFSERVAYIKKMAHAGDASAQYHLGIFYSKGQMGIPQSDREALHWVRLAADQGYGLGQYELGVYYAEGRAGLEKSEQEAARLFRLAADQGEGVAQYHLGGMHERGTGGLEKSDQKAAHWFRLSAHNGFAPAQYVLRSYYLEGKGGLEKSEQEAARWTQLAAAKGHSDAQFVLGVFHLLGQAGLEKSDQIAAYWFHQAAMQGYASAQFNLGVFCEKGLAGMEKPDPSLAARWYRLAADQGFAPAQEVLEKLPSRIKLAIRLQKSLKTVQERIGSTWQRVSKILPGRAAAAA